MTIDELKKVRQLVVLAENATILGESEFVPWARYQQASEKVRVLLRELEDGACEHDWRPLGKRLHDCRACGARRFFDAAPAPGAPRADGGER